MHSALDLRALPNALFDANWIALVAASVAVFFLNAICYSAVWDEYWFRLALPDKFKIFKHGTAEEKEKLEREMMKHFPFNLVVSFVTTLVTCIGYSAVVAVAKPEGLFEFVLLCTSMAASCGISLALLTCTSLVHPHTLRAPGRLRS